MADRSPRPTTGITLRNITVRDIVTTGNHDGIKLSGVTGFLIDGVQVRNWGTGGSAVDMVGCHHGLVQNSLFQHDKHVERRHDAAAEGRQQGHYVSRQPHRAAARCGPGRAGRRLDRGRVLPLHRRRFRLRGRIEIVAEGNVIIGGSSAFSWVNIDGGVFHHNVVHRPYRWVARILNENPGTAIVEPAKRAVARQSDRLQRHGRREFSTAVNVGAETLPDTYSFARNRWLNLANPTPAGSTPSLPTAEVGGIYGGDAMAPTDAAHVWDFPWGKWIVNANAAQKSVDVANYQSLRRATPTGASAAFKPLNADPLDGAWTSAMVPAATIQLPAFSQVILIDPAVCPNCLGAAGRLRRQRHR